MIAASECDDSGVNSMAGSTHAVVPYYDVLILQFKNQALQPDILCIRILNFPFKFHYSWGLPMKYDK